MTEQRRKRVVYAIFAIAVIWGIFNFPHRKKVTELQIAPVTEATTAAALGAPAVVAASTPTILTEWGRDPFARPKTGKVNVQGTTAPTLSVGAVSVSDGKAMAIINGKMVSKGDNIEGWRVISISDNGVVLESKGKKITLKIGSE